MQQTLRKITEGKGNNKDKIKDDGPSSSNKQDEKIKKSLSTPRAYAQKSTTSDIYTKKNTTQNVKAPKKSGITNTSKTTPMKEYLRSSPSSASQISNTSSKVDVKKSVSSVKSNKNTLGKDHKNVNTPRNEIVKVARKLPFSNVTVNSPVARRKNEISHQESWQSKEKLKTLKEADSSNSRQRTKTRTLDEKEIKILKPDVVDNNSEMLSLKSKLVAKSKAFYVGINEKPKAKKPEISNPSKEDADDSYEDDFESYESDFDSYHSDPRTSETNNGSTSERSLSDHEDRLGGGDTRKESRDEEKMLDSGNFDLREAQKSAQKHMPSMGFISEGSEDVEKRSLTDEGFQDMSSYSAVSSMKTMHVEVIERPLFIDFTKSKEKRRKQKQVERLKQRAKDILSMVTLHEMSYTLFEMKPIPYDLYMATFGRFNYIQTATQTFDDGITEEVQTEVVSVDNKWTQHPVKFSKHDVYLRPDNINKKFPVTNEDYLTKFTFMINKKDDNLSEKTVVDKEYKVNPLRIYLEQQNGVGADEMLPLEDYKDKLQNKDFNMKRLKKFLNRVESSISNILSSNTGNITTTDINKSRLPFSKGYHSISHKSIANKKFLCLNSSKIVKVIYSDTKSNLLLTISQKSSKDLTAGMCVICLWDISVALREPIRILVAIENVSIGRFRGNIDGIFIAGLEDGSIHLWDLSEEPIWCNDVGNQKKTTEINSDRLTEIEKDREWNLKNSQIGSKQGLASRDSQSLLQSSAYTSSAMNMKNNETADDVVGLEFIGGAQKSVNKDNNRKILGQICSLQHSGRLIIWNIIQDKCNTNKDIGKAYWSKMKLEKSQTITLGQYLDIPKVETADFNLNAAKRRNSQRRTDKMSLKQYNRENSINSSRFESDRPSSSKKVELPVVKTAPDNWESGIVCKDLKIMSLNSVDNFLIAKNCGEVLICVRRIGEIKVNNFCVANNTSTITCLEVSPHGLPYFLAATDSGTVNLCSVLETRVLLTLDCRNGPADTEVRERCRSDDKGRYTGTIEVRSPSAFSDVNSMDRGKWCVTSLCWCEHAPCRLVCVSGRECRAWLLPRSDIRAQYATPAVHCVASKLGDSMSLLTPEGEVQIHRITNEQNNMDSIELFKKYVALL